MQSNHLILHQPWRVRKQTGMIAGWPMWYIEYPRGATWDIVCGVHTEQIATHIVSMHNEMIHDETFQLG